MPPAVTIIAVLGFASGLLSLVFGLPLAVPLIALVKLLYMEDILHADATVPGEDKALKASPEARRNREG